MTHSMRQIWLRFQMVVLLSWGGTCLIPISRAQTSQAPLTKEPPLWSVGPRQVGYSGSLTDDSYFLIGGGRVKIQFLDNQRLALAWLRPDGIVKTPSAKATTSVPSLLHIAILDSKTGRVVSHHEMSCTSRGVNLAYTASGQWLVANDQTVTLYSTLFEQVRNLQPVITQSSHTFVSPSGRTLLSSSSLSQGGWSHQLLDSATLQVVDSWDDTPSFHANLTYSDRFILAELSKPERLFIREIGGNWGPFLSDGKEYRRPGSRTYGLLSDETLVILHRDEVIVKTLQGQELFSKTTPEGGLFFSGWSSSATSTGGERFALLIDRIRGLRNEPLDMYPFPANDRVVVYSVTKRGPIFSVRVKGPSPWYPRDVWNRIALSPDGLLLGIVSNQGVRVYLLPPS